MTLLFWYLGLLALGICGLCFVVLNQPVKELQSWTYPYATVFYPQRIDIHPQGRNWVCTRHCAFGPNKQETLNCSQLRKVLKYIGRHNYSRTY